MSSSRRQQQHQHLKMTMAASFFSFLILINISSARSASLPAIPPSSSSSSSASSSSTKVTQSISNLLEAEVRNIDESNSISNVAPTTSATTTTMTTTTLPPLNCDGAEAMHRNVPRAGRPLLFCASIDLRHFVDGLFGNASDGVDRFLEASFGGKFGVVGGTKIESVGDFR